jgi:pectinesterase
MIPHLISLLAAGTLLAVADTTPAPAPSPVPPPKSDAPVSDTPKTPALVDDHSDPSAVRIVLVGDSTVTDTKGWGPGFRKCLKTGVVCLNPSASGRSSKSYRAEGRWEPALALKGDYYLLQFGHNDEPSKGPDRATDPSTTYHDNMARYVDEVRAIGATPVLVTSLTRRDFTDKGRRVITEKQLPYVEAVRKVAAEKKVPLIDLHALSVDYCQKLGPVQCAKFNYPPKEVGKPDTTHLNALGAEVFGGMVAEQLAKVVPVMAPGSR